MTPPVDIDALATPLKKVKEPDPVIALGTPTSTPEPPEPLARPANVTVTDTLDKLTIRLDPALLKQARGAYLTELAAIGARMTWSGWVSDAIEAAVARVENAYNNSEPVRGYGVNVVPKGRMQR